MSIILTAATSPTLSAITTLIWTSGPSIAPVSPTQGWKLGATSSAPMSRRCSPLSPHSHQTPGPELKGSGSMQVSTTIQPTFGNPRWISHACMFYRIFYLHKKLFQVGDYRVQFSYSGRAGDEFTVVGRQAGREVDLPDHVNVAFFCMPCVQGPGGGINFSPHVCTVVHKPLLKQDWKSVERCATENWKF